MLTYYLSHTAIALKNAIATRNLESQRQGLATTIKALETQIDAFMELARLTPGDEEHPYQKFIRTLGHICGALDGVILRIHSDGTIQPLARVDTSRKVDLRPVEENVLKTIRANPSHKAILKESTDGITLVGYPLGQGNRLCGALFMQVPNSDPALIALLDVGAKLSADSLALYILNEEKELWENFYKANLTA